MAIEHYRHLVIGSGEGGTILAWNLAKRGEKTVVVERECGATGTVFLS